MWKGRLLKLDNGGPQKTSDSSVKSVDDNAPNPDRIFQNFSAYLGSKNIKISVTGGLDNKKRANLTALELENSLFYFDHGKLVRLDSSYFDCKDADCNDRSIKKQVTEILLSDGVYSLSKEYNVYQNSTKDLTDFGIPLAEATIDFKYAFPLTLLVEEGRPDWQQSYDTETVKGAWRKTEKYVWESEIIFRFNEIETITRDPVLTRVIFDDKYEVIKSLSIKYPGEDWQTLNFSYETLEDFDSLRTIPVDYKEYQKVVQ